MNNMAGFPQMDVKKYIFLLQIVLKCVLVYSSHKDVEFRICKDTSMGNCATGDCEPSREQPCYHGDCAEDGICICHPCWTGESCNGRGRPVFDAHSYNASIASDSEKRDVIVRVSANMAETGDNSKSDDTKSKCDCTDLYFQLTPISKRKHIPILGIEVSSGNIYLNEQGPLAPGRYGYEVFVSNPDGSQRATVPLTVTVEENMWSSVVKSRQLRAAPDVTGLTNVENNTLASSIAMDLDDAAITTVTPGDTFTLIFEVTIPAGHYVEDVIIEVFTDDNINGTFAVLCDTTLNAGPNLEIDPDRVTPIRASHTTGFLISEDTATYDLGIVKNGGGTDDVLQVSFTVTIIDEPSISDGDTYWINAGIEQYGGTRIWIGQLGFTVSREAEIIPATVIDLVGPLTPPANQPYKFTLDINSYQRFSTMTASVSTADVTQNNICRMEVCSFGEGYCVDFTKTTPSYTYVNASGHNEAAVVPFDVISYSGAVPEITNSLITLDIIVYIPSTAAGVSQTLNANVAENDGSIVDTFDYTPAAPTNAITPPGSTLTVTATASCTGDPCELSFGQLVVYEVTIVVPTDTLFVPVDIKFISDYLADGVTPAMGSCDTPALGFIQVDEDIACGNAWKRQAATMVSNEAQGPVFHLGGVMNMGYTGMNATIKFRTSLLFSPNAVAGGDIAISLQAYVAGSPHGSAVNLPSVTLSADPQNLPSLAPNDPNPAVMVYDTAYPVDSYDIPPGGFAVLQLTITPELSVQCPYVLSVGTNSSSLRILRHRVTFVGSNFVCDNTDPWLTAEGTITVGDGNTFPYDSSEFELGVVTSSRWSNTPATEQDTIVVEATVQLSEDRAIVADDSLHPVAMSILFCSSRLWVGDGSIRADYTKTYSLVMPTMSDFTFDDPVVNVVTRGGQSKLNHTITLIETTCFTYSINYTTDYAWLQITDVQLVSFDEYLPGLELHPPTLTLGGNSDGNFATIEFGSVCNVMRATPIADDESKMTFVLEIDVAFADSTEINRGSWGIVFANMVVGNGDTTQEEVKQVTYQADLPKSTFTIECPETSNSMKPGEIDSCTFTINLLDDELQLHLEIETLMNITATLNLMEVQVTSVGRNIAGVVEGSPFNLSSTDSSSQNNQAVLDGTAQNTFTHTEETGTYAEGDNDIVITITFQMTDAIVNDADSLQRMELAAAAGTYMIWVGYHDFTVERDGTEEPDLIVSYDLTKSSSNLVHGDAVFYHVNISHDTSTSTGEPINLQARLNQPLYVKFTNLEVQNTDERFPVPTHSVNDGGVILAIDRLFFLDSVRVTVEATIDCDYQFYGKDTWKATTPLQVVYQTTHRTGSATAEGEYLCEPIQYVTYQFTVTPELEDSGAPECAAPVALGMESGSIQDCQITGSFQPNDDALPSHARLNGASAWKTEARGGSFLYDRWLKVDLGQISTLTSIGTQGGASGDIASFDLLYSINDALYEKAIPTDEFNHHKSNPSPGPNDIVQHNLAMPVEARYVRIELTNYNYNTAGQLFNMLRVEFYGCVTGTPDPDPCPAAATALHMYDRGFTVAGDTLFVCDSKTHLESGLKRTLHDGVYAINPRKPNMQCYTTLDGSTWDAMPERVHNVIGYLPTANDSIFAIFENSPGYAMGINLGESWTMVTADYYTVAAADPDFVNYKAVPFIAADGFVEETIGDYKATFDGMNRYDGTNWIPILDWNSCCTPACTLDGVDTC